MNGKKSFILYCDLIHTVSKMPNDKAGELFKHLLSYVNDENPETEDLIIQLTFEPIKQQLKRDLKDWENTRVERAISGKLGGIKSGESRRGKKRSEANEANALISKQNEANEAVNVTVTVNDNVNVNDTVIENTEAKNLLLLNNAPELTDYQICVDFWLKEFHTNWTYTAVHGKAMKSFLSKIKKILTKEDVTVPDTFKLICINLPEWYKDKDLPVLNSKFNELITEIKKNNNGTSKSKQQRVSKYFDKGFTT